MTRTPLLLLALGAALSAAPGCKPKAVRGGAGTDNPNLDEGAMSTNNTFTLTDRFDLGGRHPRPRTGF